MIDRSALGDFLRSRRAALQPEDVGLPRGKRRRTSGLRREEVSALCHVSAGYYARLERGRASEPSQQMIAAIAQGLRLSLDERDHLFLLAGHNAPQRRYRTDHIDAGLMRVLDRLDDTPAEIITDLGETLAQTRLAAALLGDETAYTGLARSIIYRWFTHDPATRDRYPAEEHTTHSRIFASRLRGIVAEQGPGSRAEQIIAALTKHSAEFREAWDRKEIGLRYDDIAKRFIHPELGLIELHCQRLLDTTQAQSLLVYTAVPGSDSYNKLQLLDVIGNQHIG